MSGIMKFTEHFFWAMVWVFLLLIVGYAILHWISNIASGNFLGSFANWTTNAATP